MKSTTSNMVTVGLLAGTVVLLLVALWVGLGGLGRRVDPGAAAYRGIGAPFASGRIEGRVLFVDTANRPTAAVDLPPDCADAAPTLGLGPVPGALVWLEGVTEGTPPPSDGPRLSLGRCGFVPAASVAFVGSSVRVAARGSEHRMQAFVEGVRVFDAAAAGDASVTLVSPGIWTLRCASGHPWEVASIVVLEHPYGTASRSDGAFELEAVPQGTWPLVAWHPRLGERRVEVSVSARETETVEAKF